MCITSLAIHRMSSSLQSFSCYHPFHSPLEECRAMPGISVWWPYGPAALALNLNCLGCRDLACAEKSKHDSFYGWYDWPDAIDEDYARIGPQKPLGRFVGPRIPQKQGFFGEVCQLMPRKDFFQTWWFNHAWPIFYANAIKKMSGRTWSDFWSNKVIR